MPPSINEASLSMPEDQSLTARPGTTPATPSVDARAAERAPEPCSEPGALCRDGSYAGIVTAVRKAVERNADFGS